MNSIVLGDSRDTKIYPDNAALTITSPPYFCDKDYEADYSFDDYRELLRNVFQNVAQSTIDGGKICINIADIAAFSKVSGRVEEYIGISRDLQDWFREWDCFLLARTVWAKDDPWVNSQHVSYHDKIPATYVRQLPSFEYVWTYYKKTPSREDVGPITNYLSKEDWKRWVSSVWAIRSVKSNDDHAAKFPEELVRRLVLLYSVPGDLVLDPFCGSGTTAVVAYKNRREYFGIERDPAYFELIQKNLANVENSLEREFILPPKYKQNKIF